MTDFITYAWNPNGSITKSLTCVRLRSNHPTESCSAFSLSLTTDAVSLRPVDLLGYALHSFHRASAAGFLRRLPDSYKAVWPIPQPNFNHLVVHSLARSLGAI